MSKRNDISCPWIGIIYIVKMSILLKEVYGYSKFLNKMSMAYSTEPEFKICMKTRKILKIQSRI